VVRFRSAYAVSVGEWFLYLQWSVLHCFALEEAGTTVRRNVETTHLTTLPTRTQTSDLTRLRVFGNVTLCSGAWLTTFERKLLLKEAGETGDG
jgi:hypothetical protein